MKRKAHARPRAFLLLALAAALTVVVAPASARQGEQGSAQAVAATGAGSSYIVRLADAPVVAYEGGTAGLAATAPAPGEKVNRGDRKVQRYVEHLHGRHAAVAGAVGATKFYDYDYAFNGFAATLTPSQVAKLQARSDIVSVEQDQRMQLDTSTTPSFLELDAQGGLWSQLGGPRSNPGAGEDVIVGIVDSGIWPEHPSFSDQADFSDPTGSSGKRSTVYGPPPASWSGSCQSGEQFSQDNCNNKLIGARYFLEGFTKSGIVHDDFKSARDYDGHGSHTASTAAGNNGVPVTGPASIFGTVSGMAPRARIAAYKVCWNGDEGGCASTDSVAAIDQAVADGVDVINFSISGTQTSFLDAVEVAYLFAEKAGVFVAASAGNSGPAASTVAHPSPWLTTVAASTHTRSATTTVTLGNGVTYAGSSVTDTGTPVLPLVDAVGSGLAGATATQVRLCYPGTLDPAKVSGKIVLCERGVIGRTDKSLAVQQAGGKGMILYNATPSSLNADFHFVPTIHVDDVAGPAIRAYITAAGASATAAIAKARVTNDAPAPVIASFSSRGPSLATADQLKPDVSAPGVDVLAAVSPASGGRLFDLLSGTSMSSPHVAGLGALLTQKHRDWTPSMIKSSLMTTGYDLLGDNSPFAQGAGHVKPNSAADPGLVYSTGFADYLGFLCGTGQLNASYCPAIRIDPSDLNLASIAIGDLAGVQTVKRTVRNVSGAVATYSASVTGLAGVTAEVKPATLTIGPGMSASYTVTFTRTTAPFRAYTFGNLTWSDGTHSVRSPLVVRPVAIAAPPELKGTGTSGQLAYKVTAGYTGAFSAQPQGLAPAATTAGNVLDDPANSFVVGGPGITTHTLTIPAGTAYARISLFDEFTDGDDDLDLFVYDSAGELVATSEGGTSAEEVNLRNPAAGTYTVYVHGWQTDGPDANYTLFTWVLGATGTGNMTVTAPTSVVTGQKADITVHWTGLIAATKYLGRVVYRDSSAEIGSTVIRVDS